jgi:hypothetical protein
MKDINIKIDNAEDISYLESINYDRDIINVALTIGLKSIQMSQTTMTGNSYIEPLKQIIVENSIENHENIGKINDMLCDLLNIKNNSSRKGKLGESLAMNSLKKKYPDWKIEDTTGTAHESDMFAYSNEYGKILYEIKTYSSNVPSKEIYKFKNDMVTTNSKYGIFISQTSGIVGKKLIDYEIVNNSIAVYVSCAGLNGHGIELGTEFLLSLINSGYLERRHIVKNDNVQYVLNRLNDKMFDLKENINNFSRIKMQIDEHRNTMNQSIDTLYKHTLQYETLANDTLTDILDIVKKSMPFDISLIENDKSKDDFMNNISALNCNNLSYFEKMCVGKDFKICLSNDILYCIKNDTVYCKIYVKKESIELYFNIIDMDINLNMKYEKIDDNCIVIKILENVFNDNVWQIVESRLDSYK